MTEFRPRLRAKEAQLEERKKRRQLHKARPGEHPVPMR